MNLKVPTIETERLILDSFNIHDLNDIYKYCSNPNVANFTTWLPHKSLEDSKAYLKFIESSHSNEEGKVYIIWAIRKKSDNKVIGSFDFHQIEKNIARVDYALSENEWGQGIMTECAKAVLSWAVHKFPEIAVFTSGGLSENRASLRVMKKCGMTFKKTEMIFFEKFNLKKEVSTYEITRNQFLNF